MTTDKKSSLHIANVFFNSWVIFYGIATYIQTVNRVQFKSKLFATLRTMLGLKHLTKIAYHPRTNWWTEEYDRTVVTGLRHVVAQNRED